MENQIKLTKSRKLNDKTKKRSKNERVDSHLAGPPR